MKAFRPSESSLSKNSFNFLSKNKSVCDGTRNMFEDNLQRFGIPSKGIVGSNVSGERRPVVVGIPIFRCENFHLSYLDL